MKRITILIVVVIQTICAIAQQVGSKVSFSATDGKMYTGTITAISGNQYKVKYDGFDFEAWLTSSQFTVISGTSNNPGGNNNNTGITQTDGEWKVWVKTSPCSGRNDWISVAKENPTGGANFFYIANQIFPGTGCTTMGCTFAEATAIANTLRNSPQFSNYCCRDYSVWEYTQTGKRSVVQGKFGTAGFGWKLVKPDLCYEEAQALAVGDQNGDWKVWVKTSPCSGRNDWISVAKENPTGGANFFYLANQIFPGTSCTTMGCTFQQATAIASSLRTSPQFSNYCCRDYSVWQNTQTGKMSVVQGKFGTAGFGWQIVKSDLCCEEAEALAGIPGACSGTTQAQVQCWPGSYSAVNPQTQKVECYCNPGLVWNSTRTACVDPQELVRTADCSKYPGSYAAFNQQTQKVECWCPEGKKWNSTMTACIDDPAKITCWPGSYAALNPQTNRTECFCNPGLVWNSTKTACIEPGKINDGKIEGSANLNWVLDSVTVSPKNPKETWTHNEWSYSVQSPSAHYSIYDGAYQVDFNWTPPPQQFNSNGFTVSLNVQAKTTGGQDIAALISVSGSGLTSNTPAEQSAYANGKGSASAQKSVAFKPSPNSSGIEVKIGLMWGSVTYTYYYHRVQ